MLRIIVVLTGCWLLAACVAPPEKRDPLQFGFGLLLAEDYERARTHFESLHAEHPRDPYIALGLGVALDELGDRERAAEMYRIAVEEGAHSPVHQVVAHGKLSQRTTSAATLARKNLEALDG